MCTLWDSPIEPFTENQPTPGGIMLYAGFGAMMSTPDLIRRLNTEEQPLTEEMVRRIGALQAPGWSLGFYGKSKTWGNRSTADIQPSETDSVWVVVVELPDTALDRLCIVEGVYTGRYRFDTIDLPGGGRAQVTRLRRKDREEEPGKSSVKYVARMIKGALANNIPLNYITDVVLARAGFDHSDMEKIFHEEMYSEEIGDAGEIIREWANAHLRVPA